MIDSGVREERVRGRGERLRRAERVRGLGVCGRGERGRRGERVRGLGARGLAVCGLTVCGLAGHRPGERGRGEWGRVSVFVAATMPVMLLFLALMWDASGYLRAMHRADNVAHEAARAAGQAIDLPLAVTGERIVVDPAAAEAAAASYLSDAGVTGEVSVSDDGRQVTVSVAVRYDPLFLGSFGFGPYTAEGAADAHLVDN